MRGFVALQAEAEAALPLVDPEVEVRDGNACCECVSSSLEKEPLARVSGADLTSPERDGKGSGAPSN